MELLEEILVKEKKPGTQETELQNTYEQVFPMVAGFVSKMGGTLDDAKDIFQDALIVYLEIKAQNSDKIHTSEQAYILGIAKHLWIRKYHVSKSMISLNQFETEITIPEDFYPTVSQKRLLRFLELAGKKCMDLLRGFYYQKLPVKKLAQNLGYSNEHSVSVQKYKCLEKVRHTIKEKSLSYEDFIE